MRRSTTRHVMGVLVIVVGFVSFMLPTVNPPVPILGVLQMCGIPAMFVGLWLFLTD